MLVTITSTDMLGAIGLLWFAGLPIWIVIGYVMKSRIYSILRDKFPEIWESLGRPALFFNTSFTTLRAVRHFFRQRDYEKTGDEEFIDLCIRLRRLQLAYIIYFIGGVLLICIPILMSGQHGHHT